MGQYIRPKDIAVYVYGENSVLSRERRLEECAAHYAGCRGLPGGNFTVGQQAKGKPFFPQQPHIHFSISHSGDYWLCAFHGAPLGLDIQQHKPRDYMAIAKRWYHAEEYAAVAQQGIACFFDIWSAKESICKLDGQGIDATFAHFSVVRQGRVATCCQGLQLQQLSLFNGYSTCLCAQYIGHIHMSCLEQPLPGG